MCVDVLIHYVKATCIYIKDQASLCVCVFEGTVKWCVRHGWTIKIANVVVIVKHIY